MVLPSFLRPPPRTNESLCRPRSRYPQDFKRDAYHRGQTDWGPRSHHQKHPGYGYPPHYGPPGPMYGMLPGGARMGPHLYVAPHWAGRGRTGERHEWGGSKDPNAMPNPPSSDWVKKDPRQELSRGGQF